MVRTERHDLLCQERLLKAIVGIQRPPGLRRIELSRKQLRRMPRFLEELFSRLDASEQSLLKLRFGLADGNFYNQFQVAYMLKKLPSMIATFENRTLLKCYGLWVLNGI